MKKNVMMRVASVLLIAVMMTTCAISGTFAKYVTSNDASDSARVAKWGVTVTATGNAFAKTYELDTEDTGITNGLAVESSTDEKVVAPGTTGTFGGISVTGTPEVAVNINTEATVAITGWELASGFYCPIVITINNVAYCGLNYDSATEFASALEGAIEAANGNYEANTDLSGVTGLNGSYTWTWAFEDADHVALGCDCEAGAQTDGKDTELGNQAANGFLNKISITVKTTVTQID